MKLSNIRAVGFVLRPESPELQAIFLRFRTRFEHFGVRVFIDSASAKMIGMNGLAFDKMCQKVDILLTIGGDGTLISSVRRSHPYSLPVLGVHAGKLGFLADLNLSELESFIPKLLDGDYRIDKRAMLEGQIRTAEGLMRVIAFNDIVLTRPSIAKMIHFETRVDGRAFNTYYGDGVIIATPTGSTAYNLSAGGPVLFPLTGVFALTPISPHSLTQRPVVLPGQFEIEIKTPEPKALAIVDGQDMYEFGEGDSVRIKLALESAELIHREAFNYFDVLKEKLRWGE